MKIVSLLSRWRFWNDALLKCPGKNQNWLWPFWKNQSAAMWRFVSANSWPQWWNAGVHSSGHRYGQILKLVNGCSSSQRWSHHVPSILAHPHIDKSIQINHTNHTKDHWSQVAEGPSKRHICLIIQVDWKDDDDPIRLGHLKADTRREAGQRPQHVSTERWEKQHVALRRSRWMQMISNEFKWYLLNLIDTCYILPQNRPASRNFHLDW